MSRRSGSAGGVKWVGLVQKWQQPKSQNVNWKRKNQQLMAAKAVMGALSGRLGAAASGVGSPPVDSLGRWWRGRSCRE